MKSTDFYQASDILDSDYLLIFQNNKPVIAKVSDLTTTLIGDYLPIDGGEMTGRIDGPPKIQVLQAQDIDLSVVNTNYVFLKGDSALDPIATFGTLPEGTVIRVLVKSTAPGFDANFIITASASILTPNNLDITTNSGDYFEMISQGANVWKITSYQKFEIGTLAASGGWISDNFSLTNTLGSNFYISNADDAFGFDADAGAAFYVNGSGDLFGFDSNAGAYFNVNGGSNSVGMGTAANAASISLAVDVVSINAPTGYVTMDNNKVYANNAAAAVAAFLSVGTIYQTATGELRIVV